MPDKIRGFQTMVHVSLALGAGGALMQAGQLADDGGNAGFVIAVQFVVMLLLGPLGHVIAHQGWNWARWTCALLWCGCLPFLLMAVTLAFRANPASGGLLGTELLLQGGAVGLLFTEDAGNWFEA